MNMISSKHRTLIATTALALCVAMSAHAQEQAQEQTQEQDQAPSLSLFEPIEQTSGTGEAQPSGPRNPTASANGGPQFALIGTSRFGERYRVSVRDSSGEVITVDAGDGGSAAIPGHPGFRVTRVESRHVLLEQPANSPCFEFRDQGVTCESDNMTRLALATAEAIAPPPEPERRRDRSNEDRDSQDADASEQEGDDRPQNPFAAALQAARERGEPDAAATRAEAQRFRPRRIDPADVPEGYRLVRTPFGDRVVPE
ncbi:MAG: hypothetical protein WD071_07800 [Pseudohongiella sp.]|uniref:hypothetical protein n=1 Tax=Pseudohongiella sp. TaxID=1979412 RepID=UPI0034A0022E